MPCLKIMTNVPKSKIPNDFVSKVIPVLVEGVQKTAEKFIVVIDGDCQMSVDGNTTMPAAAGTLESIGNLGRNENRRIVKLLAAFMEKEIGVKPTRFFLTIYDLEEHNVSKGGLIVPDLLKLLEEK